MFFTQMLIVDIASFTVLVLAPVAVAQKRKLNKLGGLRGQQNNLRMVSGSGRIQRMLAPSIILKPPFSFPTDGQLHGFREYPTTKQCHTNGKYNQKVSHTRSMRSYILVMAPTFSRFLPFSPNSLKGVEQELQRIAKVSGGQADRLYDIVQENGKLQKKIQKNLESQVIQNVLQLALKNDRNMNFSFDQAELKRLKISMKQIPGITFDEKNFDGLIDDAKQLALPDIMRMLRNFLSKETPESERIVHVTPEKLSKRRFFG